MHIRDRRTVVVMSARLSPEEREANRKAATRRENARNRSLSPHLVRAGAAPDEHTTAEIRPYELRTPEWLGPGCSWTRSGIGGRHGRPCGD